MDTFIQTLRGISTNNNLEVFGGWNVILDNTGAVLSFTQAADGNAQADFYNLSGELIKSFAISDTPDYYTTAVKGVLKIRNKWSLKRIQIQGGNVLTPINLKTLSECPELMFFQNSTVGGCVGSINNLAELTGLTSITIRGTEVDGNIENLGKLTQLTFMQIDNTKVVGSVEKFIASQVSNGRTTGSFSYQWMLGSCTFNGQVFHDTSSFSWAPNSSNPAYTDITTAWDSNVYTIDENGDIISV